MEYVQDKIDYILGKKNRRRKIREGFGG